MNLDPNGRTPTALTARVRGEVRRRPFLELAAEPETNLVCFRGVRPGSTPQDRDAWNARLQAALLREDRIFVSLPVFRDARWLRLVLLNPYTDGTVVDRLFERVDARNPFASRGGGSILPG